jgi:GNAT superfamily N-acetyltransferase
MTGVAATVSCTDRADVALGAARPFLGSRPVVHNLILTLLTERAANGDPGRYWIAEADGEVVGVAFHSPQTYPATITPMPDDAVEAVVAAIGAAGIALPGVNGEAAVAARFAGHWTEQRKVAAVPVGGVRIYELASLVAPAPVPGHLRRAVPADLDLVLAWLNGFDRDTGEHTSGDAAQVRRRIDAGRFWLWEVDGPASMAASTEPVAGVARIQAVYTPPELRRRGYASACVAGVSAHVARAGLRCILYADLGYPASNSVYRRIGYRAVAEGLRYRFG